MGMGSRSREQQLRRRREEEGSGGRRRRMRRRRVEGEEQQAQAQAQVVVVTVQEVPAVAIATRLSSHSLSLSLPRLLTSRFCKKNMPPSSPSSSVGHCPLGPQFASGPTAHNGNGGGRCGFDMALAFLQKQKNQAHSCCMLPLPKRLKPPIVSAVMMDKLCSITYHTNRNRPFLLSHCPSPHSQRNHQQTNLLSLASPSFTAFFQTL